ncbi:MULTISPECIES: glycoside hydrolase family 73 protein [Enterococcus]|uniref:Glycoside hydrolase family 73 protein n=1 Tax=Enterococcus alishanensis TaxID=1303817 RepID=A0ABS6TFN0_9ENTE|nr:glycoside hydrolase family 73 protein [Enterococcus alishanensis]MBV7391688.1 glycoside hydrolase family 73 protein [Enterococcus alishanensis]
MKIQKLLFSAVVLSTVAASQTTVFAEEILDDTNVEEATEQNSIIVGETTENPLTNGENIETTHPANVLGATSNTRAASSYQQVFIDSVAPSARTLAAENDMYASVMIAQAIIESGWGQSALAAAPNYNLFGIKGNYNGQSVTFKTQEYVNGEWITIDAAFRKYPSYAESLLDNVKVIKTTSFSSGVYFYAGAWKSNTNSYKDATAYLQGRYATSPTYASTLNSVIESYNLTQYDNTNSNSMYRLYNPNSGEHFYTNDAKEKNWLDSVGWNYEGVEWQSPKSGSEVYRLYNPNSGDHHYTLAADEKDHLVKSGWKYEGRCWYSGGSTTLYRLYNPNAKTGTHHYTKNTNEHNNLVKQGWRDEGIGWYGQ